MDVSKFKQVNDVMKEGYWERWNDQVQAEIDRDIEANRKAEAVVSLEGCPQGSEVKVEQLSHDFIFGAHIFNYDQLGSDERNQRYKDLFGTLFNSATIAFYWKKFELEEGKPRFAAEYRDTAEYWNTVAEPKLEPHWRRPATDPVVEFCESKGIRLHGHTMVWGNCRWNLPEWLYKKLPYPYSKLVPEVFEESKCDALFDAFNKYSPEQIEQMLPEFTQILHESMAKRIIELSLKYKDRIHSWDVVNESATDCHKGEMYADKAVCKSWYNGLMPGDYTYRAMKIAEAYLPNSVKININDYTRDVAYYDQVVDLLERGCKIDIMGEQMHLFDPKICLDIAEGTSDMQSPEMVREILNTLGKAGLPMHLSEITITSPGDDERGQAIQAIIARNLYRLWFSFKPMMGITWWNVVDDCGAPGEPSVSGLFTRDMQPKISYHVLNDLIHNEWKTRTTVKADSEGKIGFRGFRGDYKLTWKDSNGKECSKVVGVR